MTDRRASQLAAALAEGKELEPPWARFPWIPRGSIGWRMGSGESYQISWGDFADEKLRSLDDAIAYLRRHPKAPRSWSEWIAGWLASFEDELFDDDGEEGSDEDGDGEDGDGEDGSEGDGSGEDGDFADELDDDGSLGDEDEDEDEDEEEEILYWMAFVEAEGLTGDDVAYPVFVRNALAEGGMTAPWTWRGAVDSPDSAMRYSPRELGWWARWLAQDRKTREEREAHLASQAPPPPEWQPVVAAIRAMWASGEAPRAWEDLTSGALALVPAMVFHGELPPPWTGDHPPIKDVEWEEDSDDRHRWAWWVFETFEDKATWFAYLARWPQPPRWKRALDEVSFPYLLG